MSSPSSPVRATRRRRVKPAAGRKGPVDTPTAILEAAESLFIEMGYAGTSLRAIATRAGVNLASAHYHFG
ncbi:MAG: TetR family transcriptional regulator, partial [Myxococcota bacterium]